MTKSSCCTYDVNEFIPMNFLKAILSSIYSPRFYKEIPQKPFRSAINYFLLLCMVLATIRAISLSPAVLFSVGKELKMLISSATDTYPRDLVIKIEEGNVSTNVKEPYFIPLPTQSAETKIPNLLVIDTSTPFSAAQFGEYKAIAWLGKDALFVKGENRAEIRTFDLSSIPNYTVNKDLVDFAASKISPWIKAVGPVLFVLMIIFIYVSYTARLIYLLFIALLIWLANKLLKWGLDFGQSYKLGMHAITLGLAVELVREIIGVAGFSFMFTLITLIVIAVNMWPANQSSVKQ